MYTYLFRSQIFLSQFTNFESKDYDLKPQDKTTDIVTSELDSIAERSRDTSEDYVIVDDTSGKQERDASILDAEIKLIKYVSMT